MCGVAGYISSGHHAATRVMSALVEQQNRGQASSGLSVLLDNEGNMTRRTRRGPVDELLKRLDFNELPGSLASGHVRYATAGSLEDAQPFVGWIDGQQLSLSVNGNTVNIDGRYWETYVKALQVFRHAQSDTEALLHHVAQTPGDDLVARLCQAFQTVEGAWSLVALIDDGRLVAMRDPWGFRPLWLSQTGDGYLVSSEKTKSQSPNIKSCQPIVPGEIVCIDRNLTLTRWIYRQPAERLYVCSFEWTYFLDPDSPGVYNFRTGCGDRVAREIKESGGAPTDVDGVVPVLDSGGDAADQFAFAMGLPVIRGLNRSRSSKEVRAFLGASHGERQQLVSLKHIPNPEAVAGQDLYMVDDSIVRGDTMRSVIASLRSAGAGKIHAVIASPPVTGPCYYGIATPTTEELVASGRTVEQVRAFIGADSLYYLSLEGYRECYRHLSIPGYRERLEPCRHMCDACMSGDYPPFVPPHHRPS